MSKDNHSLKMSLLAIVLTGALSIATPEYARAHEGGLKGFFFKFDARANIFSGDETPYAGHTLDNDPLDVGLDASGGFRVGGGIRIGSSWDFGVLYSGLNSSGNDPLTYVGAAPTIFAVQGFGTAVGPYSFNSGEADIDSSYDVVDFEAGYTFHFGMVNLRTSAGVRFVNTNHSTNALLQNGVGVILNQSREVDQWGIGPRVGVDLSMPLGSHGLFATMGGNASALFGDREITNTTKSTVGPVPASGFLVTQTDDSHTSYNADVEVGIGYALELGNASSMLITMGYRGEAWWDATDTSIGGLAGLPAGNPVFGDGEQDQFFHGPFLRGTLNF